MITGRIIVFVSKIKELNKIKPPNTTTQCAEE